MAGRFWFFCNLCVFINYQFSKSTQYSWVDNQELLACGVYVFYFTTGMFYYSSLKICPFLWTRFVFIRNRRSNKTRGFTGYRSVDNFKCYLLIRNNRWYIMSPASCANVSLWEACDPKCKQTSCFLPTGIWWLVCTKTNEKWQRRFAGPEKGPRHMSGAQIR